MSYVLEALKRADAQRERGQVPGLHAQPVGLPPLDDDLPAARRAPWLAVAAAVLVGGAGLAWWWSSRSVPPAVVAVATPPSPAPAAAPVAAPPLEAPLPPAVEPLRVTPKPAPAPPPAAAAPAAPKAEPAASAPGRIPPLRELPDALRRELPQLVVGGSMHSAQASQRMVILNGQLFHEGGQVTADLVVEQIRPKSVVLRYKQQRFEMPL